MGQLSCCLVGSKAAGQGSVGWLGVFTALPGGRDQPYHGPRPTGLCCQLPGHLPVHLPGSGQLHQL